MARLYCEEHGRQDEAQTIERQEHYRQEGETVLIIAGRLKSGPWLCDRCNDTLDRGSVAYLVTGLPRWITESEPRYDFAHERRYFRIDQAEVSVYGAAWPAITAASRRTTGRPANGRGQRPLCALDMRPGKSGSAEEPTRPREPIAD